MNNVLAQGAQPVVNLAPVAMSNEFDDLLSRAADYAATFRNNTQITSTLGDGVTPEQIQTAMDYKNSFMDAFVPVSSMVTIENTLEARAKAASYACLIYPDTRGIGHAANLDYNASQAAFLNSYVVYQLLPVQGAAGYMAQLLLNNLDAARAQVDCAPMVVISEAKINSAWVATPMFAPILEPLCQGTLPTSLQYLVTNRAGNAVDPVLMRTVNLQVTGPQSTGTLMTAAGTLNPLEAQQQKMALKDQHRVEPLRGMFDSARFEHHFGTAYHTMARGLLNIRAAVSSNSSVDHIALSESQVENVVTGNFSSSHGKQTASHSSISIFAVTGKIESAMDLQHALHRYGIIASDIFGTHVLQAVARFRDVMFRKLTPLTEEADGPTCLSLHQMVDLCNECLFAVANDVGAQNSHDPTSRWEIGFSRCLDNSAKMSTLANTHLAELLMNKHKPLSAPTHGTKRQAGAQSSGVKSKSKPWDKKPNASSPPNGKTGECRFWSQGTCRRATKCPFLHNGLPASQGSSSSLPTSQGNSGASK
jgi:hypothetical protein